MILMWNVWESLKSHISFKMLEVMILRSQQVWQALMRGEKGGVGHKQAAGSLETCGEFMVWRWL